MEAFINELREWLDGELQLVVPEQSPVRGYDRMIDLVECAIGRMKDQLASHPYTKKEFEVQYFKYWAPSFFKLHTFYIVLYNLEIRRITSGKDQFLQYLEDEKKMIIAFFNEHQELYRYYRSGRMDEDERYFTFKSPSRTSDFLIADSGFCRPSIDLGKLLAYEEYRKTLDAEIEKIKCPVELAKEIELKAPKSAVVEVIVPLFEMQAIWIEGRPATLKELIRLSERGFNIDLKDFSVLDNANRYRKKSTTPFLDRMKEVSDRRRERLDP